MCSFLLDLNILWTLSAVISMVSMHSVSCLFCVYGSISGLVKTYSYTEAGRAVAVSESVRVSQ